MHFKEITLVLTAKKGEHYAKVGGTVELGAGDSLETAKATLLKEVKDNLAELFSLAEGKSAPAKAAKPTVAAEPEEEAPASEQAPPKPPKKGASTEEKKPAATAGKSKPSNVIVFNRELEDHRKQLGPILKEEMGADYKKDPALQPKGPYVSSKLTEEKAPFMDAEGKILPSFKERVTALLSQYDSENAAEDDEP